MPQAVTFASNWLVKSLVSIGLGKGTAGLLASTALRLAGSAILSQIAQSFAPEPTPADVSVQLGEPTERPAKRFVYGHTRATGTPVAYTVRGNVLYGCWLLNSRPSEGNFTVYLDEREVEYTGDPYDWTTGATASSSPFSSYCKFWISLGDETAPPDQFLTEAPYAEPDDVDLFKATDGGQGCTLLWMRLDAGPSGSIGDRWPARPPQVRVEGDWSLIWDPRDAGQDPDDAATWAYSENHALCILDAARQNPVQPYRNANLDLDGFEAAADAADEVVALKAGGSEPRYRIAGTLVWSSGELEDQLMPMYRAGAAQPSRIGGKLSIVPGVERIPVTGLTITDMLDDGALDIDYLQPGDELATQIIAAYTSPERGYEQAELSPWDIPGAQAADGGIPRVQSITLYMASSATQAMRVRKILGYELRRQRTISAVLPPEAFELIAGSVAPVALPTPFDALDGDYEAMSVHPALDLMGENGVALRCPAVLKEVIAGQYDWDAATEEEDVLVEEVIGSSTLSPPGPITFDVVEADLGTHIETRIQFEWGASSSSTVERYEWRYREEGTDVYSGGSIDVSNEASVDLQASFAVDPTKSYETSVRSISGQSISDWTTLSGLTSGMALTTLSLTAEPGRLRVAATAPGLTAYDGVRVYRNTVDDFGSATAISDVIQTSAGAAFDVVIGDGAATDIITNGTFDTDSDWAKGAGWSIGAGIASRSGGGLGTLKQMSGLVAGTTYRWTFDVLNRTAGNISLRLRGDIDAAGPTISAEGTHWGTLDAPTNPTWVSIRAESGFVGDVDNMCLVADSVTAAPQGPAYFWVVPVTTTGSEGDPSASEYLTIT